MELIKNLFVIGVLGAVGYGVYVSISGPDDSAPPSPGSTEWESAPEVDLGNGSQSGSAGDPRSPSAEVPLSTKPNAGSAPQRNAQWSEPNGSGTTNDGGIAKSQPTSGQAGNSAGFESHYLQHQRPSTADGGELNVADNELGVHSHSLPESEGVLAASAISTGSSPLGQSDRGDFDSQLSDDAQPSGQVTTAVTPPESTDNGDESEFANRQFEAVLASASADLGARRFDAALATLSPWFGDTRLSAANRQQLTETLDQLAGTVIYSREHHLEPPYEVKDGDRLEDIADRYQVPWQLLAKINGLVDPRAIQPGEKIKVIRGPFAAVVDLTSSEITLVVGERYAGRFPIRMESPASLPPGRFSVQEKLAEPPREKLAAAGADSLIAGSTYAGPWLGLSGGVGLHGGADDSDEPVPPLPNCLQLSRRDITDLQDILSVGSDVIIRR